MEDAESQKGQSMSDFTRILEVKGRKRYQCDLCLLPIRKGAKHLYVSGVYDGDFINGRRHAVCHAATFDWDALEWENSAGCDAEFREGLGIPRDGMIAAWHRRRNEESEE